MALMDGAGRDLAQTAKAMGEPSLFGLILVTAANHLQVYTRPSQGVRYTS